MKRSRGSLLIVLLSLALLTTGFAQHRQKATTTVKESQAAPFTKEPAPAATIPAATIPQTATPVPVSEPVATDRFKAAADRTLAYLPDLAAGLLVLIIGCIVAVIARGIALRVLPKTGFDGFLERRGLVGPNKSTEIVDEVEAEDLTGRTFEPVEPRSAQRRIPYVRPAGLADRLRGRNGDIEANYPASSWVAQAIFWTILLITLAQVARSWHMETIAAGLSTVIAYIPHILAAVLIFLCSVVVADWVRDRVIGRPNFGQSRLVGGGVKAVVLTFGGFMALRELQIAPDIVRIAFTLVLGAIALSVALAFGLGGRIAAERITNEFYEQAKPAANRDSFGNAA